MSESSSAAPPQAINLTGEASPPASESAQLPPPSGSSRPLAGLKPEPLASSVPPSAGQSASRPSTRPLDRPLTIADLEWVLELCDNRLSFDQAERETKICRFFSYWLSKPKLELTHDLLRRIQGASSVDELLSVLEADLLEHKLYESDKERGLLTESIRTYETCIHSLKERVAQFEDREVEYQRVLRASDVDRTARDAEKSRLELTIADCEQRIASLKDDYHRDAAARQLIFARCYELAEQNRQLSNELTSRDGSGYRVFRRQLQEKDLTIQRLQRSIRQTPLVGELQRNSPFLMVAAMLALPMPGLNDQELTAFHNASQ
ncbi:hypothetical protein PHYBOEH_011221 [Phytophthora boehmeriae]|uniref:Uncharacterized protein n=1 Tax=Phytophthora boehmeriae TaxID=109152 RepID=A0A8T1VLG4_9STRA|nr:hypothetical protein PHYBOEH_011221 [Phytophthora boehmeriae]